MPLPFGALFSNIGWSLALVGSSDVVCQRIEYKYEQERKEREWHTNRRVRRRGRHRRNGDPAAEDDSDSDEENIEAPPTPKLIAEEGLWVPDLSRSARLMLSFGPVTDTLIFFQYQFGNPIVCPIGTSYRAVKLALFDNFVFWPVLCVLSVGISSLTQEEVPASQRFKADYCPVYWSGALMYFPPQVLIFQCISQSYQMAALKAITFCYGVSASFLTNRRLVSADIGREFQDEISTPPSAAAQSPTPYVSPRSAHVCEGEPACFTPPREQSGPPSSPCHDSGDAM